MIIKVSDNSDFSIHNIPFGIFSTDSKASRVGAAIGDQVIDLLAVAEGGHFSDLGVSKEVFHNKYLNDFIAEGKSKTRAVRKRIQKLLADENSPLKEMNGVFEKMSAVQMHLPISIGDYTDFYSSIEHATNVGKMFRDPENALLPNWKHLPVGYHGRASSIVVSGTPIIRPKGQVMPKGAANPIYSASRRVDFELETAFIIGKNSQMGRSISTAESEDYIFGKVLFNDWSARDIQKWEYVPLGPFLGKSFASSISPWVVTLEALEPFKVAGPHQNPEVLPYLKYTGNKNYDINLEASLTPDAGEENIMCKTNFKYMYWNMSQQLAHHTVNGCNVKVGDMMASGTISGKDEHSYGSMLEISWSGSKPISLTDGSTRTFIEDGDKITLRGHAEKDGIRVGFGKLEGKILPAYEQ